MPLRRAAEQDNELAPPHSKCGEICAGCTPRPNVRRAAKQGIWSRDRHGEATHPPPKRASPSYRSRTLTRHGQEDAMASVRLCVVAGLTAIAAVMSADLAIAQDCPEWLKWACPGGASSNAAGRRRPSGSTAFANPNNLPFRNGRRTEADKTCGCRHHD